MKKILIGFILAILVLPVHSHPDYQSHLLQFYDPAELTETLETTHFTIRYREDYALIAQKVADLAEDVYDDVTSFMEYTPQEKIEIHLEPVRYNFAFGITTNDNVLSLQWGCPFSTESFGTGPLTRKWIMAYGLSGLFLLRMTGTDNTVFLENQLWLGLGISAYCASKGEDPIVPIAIYVLQKTGNVPTSLDDILYENYALLAQPLSFTAVEYMFDEYGEEDFSTFLHALEEWNQGKTSRQNIDTAMQKAFGVTIEEFEQGWLLYLEEFPPLQEECNAVAITDSWGFKVVSGWYNSKILYTGGFRASMVNKNNDIFIMNADGSNVKKLTDSLVSDFDPKFSPDGETIAFTSVRDGYLNIYCMDKDGSGIKQLTFDKSMDYMGSWSPDGDKIAFTSGRSGNWDIYIMDKDGSGIQQVTKHPGADGWPVFSLNGQNILFVSDRSGAYDLYTMNFDGSNITQLTDTLEYENFPQYSPDGEMIAFSSRGETKMEICVMNADGTRRDVIMSQPVTVIDEKTLPSLVGYPVWSPDGEEIAFIVGTQIFTVPVNQQYFDFWWIIIPVLVVGIAIVLLKVKKERT